MAKQRDYTPEFKRSAMMLVTEQHFSISRAARELGMPFGTLALWLRKAGWTAPVESDLPPSEDPKVLNARIAELERQVRRLETDKEILKKATEYFARENR
jgi:transposase-like protein